MKEKDIILSARIISMVFTPFYLPVLGLLVLFVFSYLSILPTLYKLFVLLMVYVFTVLAPTLLIHAYRSHQGWTPLQLGVRERRMVPYVLSIFCYFACYYLMNLLHIPHFMSSILVAALMIQILCATVNVWYKISTHTAAIGGVAGAILAFAFIFEFNPQWWFCLTVIIGGMVGTSRMILRQHTLSQIVTGFALGLTVAFLVIITV